jgi:hypothetical protein
MQMLDAVRVCLYCGEVMEAPNKEQIKIFGKPICCGYEMVLVERNKILTVTRSLDKLKANLEKQIIQDLL